MREILTPEGLNVVEVGDEVVVEGGVVILVLAGAGLIDGRLMLVKSILGGTLDIYCAGLEALELGTRSGDTYLASPLSERPRSAMGSATRQTSPMIPKTAAAARYGFLAAHLRRR